MDLRQLLTLRTVVDKGSFSHAAEELGISQPAVSFQIRALEERIGQRLLDRSGRRVTLTDAGRVVDAHARRLLALEDEMLRDVAGLSDHLSGPLVLGSSTGPGELLLPHLLGGFKRENPEVEVSLVVQAPRPCATGCWTTRSSSAWWARRGRTGGCCSSPSCAMSSW